MDERTNELVAIGAAATADRPPSIDRHLAKCDVLGISRDETAEAVKVSLMVIRADGRAIGREAQWLLGQTMSNAAQAADGRAKPTVLQA